MDEYTKQSQLRGARLEERSQLREAVRKGEGKEARQRIRDRFDEVQKVIEEGGIYDVSTDTYEPTKGNEPGTDTNLDRTGIHEASRPRTQEPSEGGEGPTGIGNAEFEAFDVVDSDNNAAQRFFLVLPGSGNE